MERTLVLIKPDAVQRDLVGAIISRLELKGLKLVGIKMMVLNDSILEEHYLHLKNRSFFPDLKRFMKQTPIIATCWEGPNCVEAVRLLTGITASSQAEPGTVRGDLGMSVQANLVHASDTIENARIEIDRFFESSELFSYQDILEQVIYSSQEMAAS